MANTEKVSKTLYIETGRGHEPDPDGNRWGVPRGKSGWYDLTEETANSVRHQIVKATNAFLDQVIGKKNFLL